MFSTPSPFFSSLKSLFLKLSKPVEFLSYHIKLSLQKKPVFKLLFAFSL